MTAEAPARPVVSAGTEHHRPELQGLRAVAVGVVVLFHLWPNRLPGGYVGVDVFFVISGYLITSHLYREVRSSGTVALRRFWARRIRRLLPASLLVLAASAAAVVGFVPATLWPQTARQIAASALYVQNWALAADAVDYMAADNVPTVAQHYWSLSVEEQFYLIWPVLVLVLVAWSRRRAGRQRAALLVGLGAVAAASFAASVVLTRLDQAQAYLVTQTRAWEFAAGALLAVAPAITHGRWRGPVAWAGLVAIGAASLTFTPASAFPGWIALLPVLGTVAVIATAGAGGSVSPRALLSWRPATWVGDVSYSVYLWHWPLIVVWPFVTGHTTGTVDKVAIAASTLVLAGLTKALVEDPGRTRPLLAAAPWRAFAFAAAGMAVVVGAAVAVQSEVDRRAHAAQGAVARATELGCTGPAALDPDRGCAPVTGLGPFVPPPEAVVLQNTSPLYPDCQASFDTQGLTTCDLGATTPGSPVVALVGDSHATQWFAAFDDLGKEAGFTVRTYTRSGCPFTAAVRVLETEDTDAAQRTCAEMDARLLDVLVADREISLVVTASYTNAYQWAAPEGTWMSDPRVDGFATVFARIADAGTPVLALSDVPLTQGDNVPNCLALHADDPMACAVPRAQALPGSALVDAVASLDRPEVTSLDLSNRFCDSEWCYPVVGNVIVYRDYSHLSADYARALIPDLAGAVLPVIEP